ncbi:Telomere repeats-binding bouquet formation protein 1 [Merluccius polli]|uniref:Telomere repeats-binding bouquet formation protein 1 n=1 Tax=Merluccius polli TaxID=89951 RepID=A0AA47MUY5_MERPO|nr:Telomere repeats-binding bouquet formation protein 1 [Merluccius polli]
MKCPESQKQALLAIFTICQNRGEIDIDLNIDLNTLAGMPPPKHCCDLKTGIILYVSWTEDNVDLFREMGGVAFVYSLSKASIVHPDVKETALFTLGTLAEANVYCKSYLCKKDTFSHLATVLMIPDSPVTLRRVSVYLLSVLVANNKLGQTFAQNTGCLDVLLELFRNSPFSTSDENPMPHNVSQMYQLWTSAATALCGCINNPQNEDAQRICVAAYPLVKTWLQRITIPCPEMFQPLCFFIAMSVGNNSYTQESFSASGCLETLTGTLVRLAADAEKSLLCCQMSVIITRTLSSCITDNAVLVRALAQYGLVPQLVSLLSSTHLDPQDRVPVLLTLGHCTEASEEHQLQLVQCGGLSTIITLLTEFPTEELRKAATFILQTCKQATMSLGGPVGAQGEDWEEAGAFTNMDAYWKSANELLYRIHRLEKRQQGVAWATDTTRRQGDEEMWTENLGGEENYRAFSPLACAKQTGPRGEEREGQCCWRDSFTGLPLRQRNDTEHVYKEEEDQKTCVRRGNTAMYPVQSHLRRRIFKSNKEENLYRGAAEYDRESEEVHALHQKDNSHVSHVNKKYSQPENHPANRCTGSCSAARSNTLALGQAFGGALGPDVLCSMCKGTGTVIYTSDLVPPDGAREPHTDGQVLKLPAPIKQSMSKERKLIADDDALSLCSELLDNEIKQLSRYPEVAKHVAQPLGERCSGCVLPFDAVTSRTFWALQSSCRHSCDMHRVLQEASEAFRAQRMLFRRKTPGGAMGVANAHWDAHEEVQERQGGGWRGMRRQRNDFSHEEVQHLLNGVKKFGSSWNSILWSYPFQPGRTNVNLAKKYRQLMVPGMEFTTPKLLLWNSSSQGKSVGTSGSTGSAIVATESWQVTSDTVSTDAEAWLTCSGRTSRIS